MTKREEYLWKDPFLQQTSHGAVLLSDQISVLASEIDLVDPFSTEMLRPAAYDVRVGTAYYRDDEPKNLVEHESFEVPANGLVYVRALERFNIPYYLIARYSLRVQQVYRGLLIDNGLHIDPGYSGCIWIPVHNFTTEPRRLVPGEPFISVEFNRTTPLPASVQNIKSQDELVSIALRNELLGSGKRPLKIFYKNLASYESRDKDFVPPAFWSKYPHETHQSAMLGTELRVAQLKTDFSTQFDGHRDEVESRVKRVESFGLIAIVTAIIGLLAILLPILYGKLGSIADSTAADLKTEIRALRDQVQEQKVQIETLSTRTAGSNSPAAAPNGTKKGR